MIEEDLSQFIETIAAIETPTELRQATVAFLNGRGVHMVSYHHFSSKQGARIRIASDGFPEGWISHYIEHELYLVDPIPELAAQTARPFRWSDIAALVPLTRKQQGYLTQLRDWQVGDGLAVQVYGPGLRNGYVGLGFAGDPVPVDSKSVIQLQIAAQISHQRYCEMSDAQHKPHYDLSPREREILRWIAKGKSNTAISDALDISPHTVDTHLRRIYGKLSVTDRTSAAIVGLGSSLIQPEVYAMP